jgi:hypothetical protein
MGRYCIVVLVDGQSADTFTIRLKNVIILLLYLPVLAVLNEIRGASSAKSCIKAASV